MSTRLQKFISVLKKHKIDAYLVTDEHNITYLTEFPASESWLLVTPWHSYYLTDFRYVHEAQKGLKGNVSVRRYTESLYETLFETVRTVKAKTVGFDDRHISLAIYRRLKQQAFRGIKLVVKSNWIEELRQIKEVSEINLVRQALKINLEAYKYIQEFIKPGVSEKQLLFKLEEFVKGKGVGFSFSPIVASGPNSSYPHAKVTDRKVQKNDVVLIDMGIDVKGYKSDLTRMFFLGKITPLVRHVNDLVSAAQQKAIAHIQAGRVASGIDAQARNYLEKNRLGKYFGHSLGHGVGLQIHEAPRISQTSPVILKENMIFTVEPAVYIPHKFGIRIEDMVLVTKKGCEVLSDHRD